MPFGIHFVDIPIRPSQRAPIRFTFFWPADERWEGRDYAVNVEQKGSEGMAKPTRSTVDQDPQIPAMTRAARAG